MKKRNKNRAELIRLSGEVKKLQALGQINGTINQMIMEVFYPEGKYNTYAGWKKKGYQVKKGSKSFSVWGTPRKAKAKSKGDDDDGATYNLYPVANLFHEDQVELIEETA